MKIILTNGLYSWAHCCRQGACHCSWSAHVSLALFGSIGTSSESDRNRFLVSNCRLDGNAVVVLTVASEYGAPCWDNDSRHSRYLHSIASHSFCLLLHRIHRSFSCPRPRFFNTPGLKGPDLFRSDGKFSSIFGMTVHTQFGHDRAQSFPPVMHLLCKWWCMVDDTEISKGTMVCENIWRQR